MKYKGFASCESYTKSLFATLISGYCDEAIDMVPMLCNKNLTLRIWEFFLITIDTGMTRLGFSSNAHPLLSLSRHY